MRRADVVVCGLTAVLAGAVCLLPLPGVLHAIAALPLVTYLPGYALVMALGRRPLPGAARSVCAVALSLAVTIVVGLGLHLTQGLSKTGWAVTLPVVVLAASAVAVWKVGPVVLQPRRKTTLLPRGRAAALVVALLAIGGAVGLARHGALTQAQYAYTDLWMVPDATLHPSSAEVGVRNEEGFPTSYQIKIVSRGVLTERTAPFQLASGEEKTLRIAVPNVAFAAAPTRRREGEPDDDKLEVAAKLRIERLGDPRLRVEALLFKNGDRNVAYRRVWATIPKEQGAEKKLEAQKLDDLAEQDLARASEDVSGEARVFARIDARVVEAKPKPREP